MQFYFMIVLYLIYLILVLVQTIRGKQREIVHVHYVATSQYQNSCPTGHQKFLSFGEPVLEHQIYTLSLPNLYLGVEKMNFIEIIYFHYKTCIVTPQHKNYQPRGHEVYKFDIPFLSYHLYTFKLSESCITVQNNNLKQITSFTATYGLTLAKNPYPSNHDLFLIWGDPSSVQSSYLNTYFVCSISRGREEDVRKKNMSQYITYLTKSLHKNPCPVVMKPFLGHLKFFLGHHY